MPLADALRCSRRTALILHPRRQADEDPQRSAFAIRFDLHRSQAPQHAPGHDLSARTVRSRQDEEQLVIARGADPVERPQL
jgi:hypothetical protein